MRRLRKGWRGSATALALTFVASSTAVALSAGNASARSLTIRHDPNDVHSSLDIRTVWSDLADGRVYLRIRSWDQLATREIAYNVSLDTRGSDEYDRLLQIFGDDCVLFRSPAVGQGIGSRPSHRPDHRDVSCNLPAGWFHIRKAVRFRVDSVPGSRKHPDRAPDHGRYIGL
jgi:hypothetical protein